MADRHVLQTPKMLTNKQVFRANNGPSKDSRCAVRPLLLFASEDSGGMWVVVWQRRSMSVRSGSWDV